MGGGEDLPGRRNVGGRQTQPGAGGMGYPGTGLAWQRCPNLGEHSRVASSPSWVMPAALGAGCCASKAGGVPQVGQGQCLSRAGWHCLGVSQSTQFPRESWCLSGWGLAPPPAAPLAGHGWGRISVCGGDCWGGWQRSPHPPYICCPPHPQGLHQVQRKRFLITFQEKQQLEKITASCLPASASPHQAEGVSQPPALPRAAWHYLAPGCASPITIVTSVCQGLAARGCPMPWEVPSPLCALSCRHMGCPTCPGLAQQGLLGRCGGAGWHLGTAPLAMPALQLARGPCGSECPLLPAPGPPSGTSPGIRACWALRAAAS